MNRKQLAAVLIVIVLWTTGTALATSGPTSQFYSSGWYIVNTPPCRTKATPAPNNTAGNDGSATQPTPCPATVSGGSNGTMWIIDNPSGNAQPCPNVKTPVPTAIPTAAPTAAPTAVPTTVPTSVPTSGSTATPTVKPTTKPTVVPTVKPTAVPTAKPTPATIILLFPSPRKSSWRQIYSTRTGPTTACPP